MRQPKAAEWSVVPLWNLKGEYNSNIRLTNRPHDGVFGVKTDIGADFGMATEVTNVSVKPVGTYNRYSNNNLDSNELRLNLDANHQSEHMRLGLQASYAQESTLTNQLEDTGLVQIQKEADTTKVNPAVTYVFDEQNNIQLEYSYTDETFIDAATTGLFGYTYHVVHGTYTHALSDVSQVFAYAAYAHFDVTDLLSTTDSYYARLGYSRKLSHEWDITASGGGLISESQFPVLGLVNRGGFLTLAQFDQSSVARGWLADVLVKKRFERGALQAEYSRTVSPSARGSQTQRDTYSLTFNHRYTERLGGQINLRYFTDQTQQPNGFGASALNRDYLHSDVQVIYRLNEYWQLLGGYHYTYQEYLANNVNVNSNSFTVMLSYSGEKLAKSR